MAVSTTLAKMKKATFTLIFLFVLSLCVKAQQIGVHFDLNGNLFNGYFDQLAYQPEKTLLCILSPSSSIKGHYFTNDGIKEEAILSYDGRKLYKKQSLTDSKQPIPLENIKSVKVKNDSFIVISNYEFRERFRKKKSLAKYIGEYKGTTFVKRYHVNSDFEVGALGMPELETSFLAREKDSSSWKVVSSIYEDDFLDKYFGHIPFIKKRFDDDEFIDEYIPSLLKTAKYHEKFLRSEPLFFDRYWNDIKTLDSSTHQAEVLDFNDTTLSLRYYAKGKKLYEASYSSLFPHKLVGDFISYYSNGNVKQHTKHKNQNTKEIWLFKDNSDLHLHYEIQQFSKENIITFFEAIDESGNNVMRENGKSLLQLEDKNNGIVHTATFDGKKLSSIYHITKSDTVFFHTNRSYSLKINVLNKNLNYFMQDIDYQSIIDEKIQGYLLISINIDKSGFAKDAKRLNTIHPLLDNSIDKFIKVYLNEASVHTIKFKPYKKASGRKKYLSNVVVPIYFGTSDSYLEPDRGFRFWKSYFQMSLFPYPYTPPMPTGF